MKRTRKYAWLGAALVLAGLVLSCASQPTVPYNYNKPVAKKSFDDPSTGVLVYGSAGQIKSVLSFLAGEGPIENLQLVQLNPQKEPMIITPARIGSYFYTQPLPVGASLKFFYYTMRSGNTVELDYRGMQGKGPSDVRLDKPGLLYLGSLVYCDKGYMDTHTFMGRKVDPNEFDLYPAGTDKEIDILKAILPKFRKTAWETLIINRIEELKK